jgi:hypothetical protein
LSRDEDEGKVLARGLEEDFEENSKKDIETMAQAFSREVATLRSSSIEYHI